MVLQRDLQSLVIWKLVHVGPHSRPAESETAQRPKFSQTLHVFLSKLQSSGLEHCFDAVVQHFTYLQYWKMCKENLWHRLNIAAKLMENLLYIFYSRPSRLLPILLSYP